MVDPGQDDFRNFCIADETDKIYRILEETL